MFAEKLESFSPVATLAALLGCSSCLFVGEDHPAPHGTLVVDWTIEDTKDPRACSDWGADRIDVVVETSDGAFVGEYAEACEAFATSIPLFVGDYRVSAALLDVSGAQLTTNATERFPIYEAESHVSAFDFPANSFH